MEATVYDAFLGAVFKSLRASFHLYTPERERSQNGAFSKASVFISVFGRFRLWKIGQNASKKCVFRRERISVVGDLA